MNRSSVITGIVLIIIAIVLGAFGAHALKDRLTADELQSFEVGVRYQMYHGIALLAIGLGAEVLSFSVKTFTRLILIGTIMFSGSIYLLSLQGMLDAKMSFLGPITPLGGILLITAWIILLIKVIKKSGTTKHKTAS